MAEQKQTMDKFIVGMVIIGITLVIGIMIAATMQSNFDNGTLQTFSVANESGGWINETGYQFAEYDAGKTLTSVVVIDTDDNSTVAANLYTVNATWFIFNATETTLTQVAISYVYTTGAVNSNAAANASGDLITALTGGSDWITIVIVVGFAVIVLSMLNEGLGKAAKGKGNVPLY